MKVIDTTSQKDKELNIRETETLKWKHIEVEFGKILKRNLAKH